MISRIIRLTRHRFLLSCWYPRAQISLRISMFYTISQSFAGMSAILSYGVSLACRFGVEQGAGGRCLRVARLNVFVALGGHFTTRHSDPPRRALSLHTTSPHLSNWRMSCC